MARKRRRPSPRSVRSVHVAGHRRGPRAPNHGKKRKATVAHANHMVPVRPYVRAKPQR